MKNVLRFFDSFLHKLAYRKWFSILAFFLLGFVIYSNILNAPFVLDDKVNISGNFAIRDVNLLLSWWSPTKTRVIGYLTFALNYKISGLNLIGFHLTNIFIHITTTILLWRLVFVIFQTPKLKSSKLSKHKHWIALFAALIFLTHPIQTQAVTYIVQRFASLSTLFYVLSIYFYAKARITKNIYYFAGFVISTVLGFLTKETAFTIPVMILLFEFYFLDGFKKIIQPKFAILWLGLIVCAIKFITIISSRTDALLTKVTISGETVTNISYLITQFAVSLKYIRLLLLPINQNLDHYQPVLTNIFNAQVVLGFVLVCFFVLLAIFSFKKFRFLSFSIVWFLVTLAPESSIFPIKDLMEEHRLYLPMVGFSLFSVLGVYYLLVNKFPKKWIYFPPFLIIFYCLLTFQRNFVWRSDISLWSDVAKKNPENTRAFTNLGSIYFKNKDFQKAEYFTNKALSQDPENPDALNNIGAIYAERGQLDKSIDIFNRALELKPDHIGAYSNKAAVYFKQGKYDDTISAYKEILRIDPYNTSAYEVLSYILTIVGRDEEAKEYINKGIRIDPNLESALRKIESLKKSRNK